MSDVHDLGDDEDNVVVPLKKKNIPHVDAITLALEALKRGWNPVPVHPSPKKPIGFKWQQRKVTRENVSKHFSGEVSVGIQMGPVSGGLGDTDLDCIEVIKLAPYFLPKTDAIYGRGGKPCSHRLYIVADPEEKAWIKWSDEDKKVLLELKLGGGGKGSQCVMPGSVHPSGELYAWEVDGDPAHVACSDLKAACTKLAAAALLARHWSSKGALHDCALGVGGFLARARWSPVEVEHFVYSICRELHDVQEPKKHGRTARDSAEAFAKGEPVRGLPWMIEFFGKDVAETVAKIINYGTTEETSGELAELNNKYCVVMEGGKVRVLTFSQQHGREMVNYLTFSDFRNLYMNKYVVVGQDEDGNATTVPMGAYWLKHKERRQYEAVIFDPSKSPTPMDGLSEGRVLNLWRGWGVEPQSGDWSLMQQHILEVLAPGDNEHAEYIFNFAAWCVQHPSTPAEVALVFKGPEGTGRGIFGRALCRIFGQHAHQISSIKHLTGDFNMHLRDCCFLFADEAFWPGFRNYEGTLKRIITEPTLFIEPKGINGFEVKNMLHVVMVSNNSWVIPASLDARRFMMLTVAEHHKQDASWFEPLYQQMEDGGYGAMLRDLLKRDLGDLHPRRIIKTEALFIQQMISLDTIDPFDAWWFALLKDGILPGFVQCVTVKGEDGKSHDEYCDPNPRRAFSKLLYAHARVTIPRLKFESDNALGHSLRKRGCTPFNNDGRGWTFPPLKEAREEWEKRVGTTIGWDDGDDEDDEFEDWQERVEDEPRRHY